MVLKMVQRKYGIRFFLGQFFSNIFFYYVRTWEPIVATIYSLKSAMETTEQCMKVCNKDPNKHQTDLNDVVQVSLLFNLDKIRTLFWCFHC